MIKHSFFAAASLAVLLACHSMPAHAETTTLWVNGVSEESGWYDANKENPRAEDADNKLCFAASAANLVAWWQSQYVVDAATPNTIDAIWATYKNAAVADEGGDTHGAVQWWISGVYMATTAEERARTIFGLYSTSTLASFDGYYFEQYELEQYSRRVRMAGESGYPQWVDYPYALSDFLCADLRGDATASSLIAAIQQGCGVGISIASYGYVEQEDGTQEWARTLSHAITLWGVEYDESGDIIGLWLTDSDDAQYGYNTEQGLFHVDTYTTDAGLVYFDKSKDANWYTNNTYYEEIYIDGIFAIDPAVSNAWGLTLIPEPVTVTLSLTALVALAIRRRRA